MLGLITMIVFTQIVEGKSQGTDKMKDLAAKIHKGAVDFLVTEYKFLAAFVVFIFTATAILASRKRGQEVVENDDPLFQLL